MHLVFNSVGDGDFRLLREDSGTGLYRGAAPSIAGGPLLLLTPLTETPTPATLQRLSNELALQECLDEAWAAKPIGLRRIGGVTTLLLKDPGGDLLEGLLGAPMDLRRLLAMAIGIAGALRRAHLNGLVHRNLQPANILVTEDGASVHLTGFGIASSTPRAKGASASQPLEGTLAYMAPEQSGRLDLAVDARSDLYSLGIVLYQMATGALPFDAVEPMEWVHCHVARQPVAPSRLREGFPETLSCIVMKLLEKSPDLRYQTAAGLESDLHACLRSLEETGTIAAVPLGLHDTPSRLRIPKKVYGREWELKRMEACLERAAHDGNPQLLLVKGSSGMGKSTVVDELRTPVAQADGLFAAGKFDQNRAEVPYAPFVQALQQLVRHLLGRSESDIGAWRTAFHGALGANGQLMTDLIPELAIVIGEQPPPAELPAQQAHARFQLVFRRFLGVFARPGRPLVLFLDDVQWADSGTLELLREIFAQSSPRNLVLICAYRDNEVAERDPLDRTLDAIRRGGAGVTEVEVGPLGCEQVEAMMAETMRGTPESCRSLAELVHRKTGGNPFFVVQFLTSLADEGVLAFDQASGTWTWDLGRIIDQEYTDNVVDLMVGRLGRLPPDGQRAVALMACIGSMAEPGTLAAVLATSVGDLEAVLSEARSQGLVERTATHYRFAHDRIQEAAYALIPAGERDGVHLHIGRSMTSHMGEIPTSGRLFEAATQLNRAIDLIESAEERLWVAELNLAAGKRAKASAAYATAMAYFAAGSRALPGEPAGSERLRFALDLAMAECEFVTGQPGRAEERVAKFDHGVLPLADSAAVTRLRGEILVALSQHERAIEVALVYLARVGIDWVAKPAAADAAREHQELLRRFESHPIESLRSLPAMSDADAEATMEVLTQLAPASFAIDPHLFCMTACRMASLSIDHGNCRLSGSAYVMLGLVLGPYFGDYRSGFEVASLGLDMVEAGGQERFMARALLLFGAHVTPWSQPVRQAYPLLRRAFAKAEEMGDVTFAGYCLSNLATLLLAGGDDLSEVQSQAEAGMQYASDHGYTFLSELMTPAYQLARSLRGTTSNLGSLDSGDFIEEECEERLARYPLAACWYWTRKLQARFLAGLHEEALHAAAQAQRVLGTSVSLFEAAEYHFHAALAWLAVRNNGSCAAGDDCLAVVAAHEEQLRGWAAACPQNFQGRAALVGAEVARIQGRELDAMRLYEQSIVSADANGLVHVQALANELAAGFYAQAGFELIARAYLREARLCYARWGAHAKVAQLETLYPYLRENPDASRPPVPDVARIESLDLDTVLQVSQTISGEMVLHRLVDTLMRTVMEYSGSETALLLVADGDGHAVESCASIEDGRVVVRSRHEGRIEVDVPEPLVRYVLRTGQAHILDDASQPHLFSGDAYFQRNQVRSALCLPLLSRTRAIGVLYIENNLAPHVFTSERLSVLKLISSQAAISLENARLYQDIDEREARIRRLVESDVIGIVIWRLGGTLVDANDAFLDMLQYGRADIEHGLDWLALTPPEWREVHFQQEVDELATTGAMRAREKEFFRKDGSRVPVLIGAAVFEGQPDQGVAYILDLTELKRAEAEARENESRYQLVQAQLAHANRISTMGQLTGSIAHEVNQPLAATVINAQTALRLLQNDPPNLGEVGNALACIIKDGNRAGDIIARIRGLIKKTPFHSVPLEVNELVREVILLIGGEVRRNDVDVRLELADGPLQVRGDRVQLQQVVLNLLMNALEAMAGDPGAAHELAVRTRALANAVEVEIQDNGPGIPPDVREMAFEAFYTKSSGLGMGLSICRSIVEAHGGHITVDDGPRQGAIIRFRLPVDDSAGRCEGALDGAQENFSVKRF